ncbi:MAG: rRNA pseudouridine synthase [Planctomycetes bacterium]|nr:rRNA pseudouridine synthase [Planctomycetota bacterium]MCB9910974.1 rRNA pseudouridine synthase [Planctomycetota bacterium]MCB9911559.1 rRNA pseudouridine synthase [Planctomycetota bacterium]HPF13250.1 pseudouridine synthase [Planctomycetota bacterium]HRV80654.1 pseudouridine synthase [Planctomycetota bacterium]
MASHSRRSRGPRRGPRTVTNRRLPARSSTARDDKRDEDLIRLNKFLADQGIASRRACDELIVAGKVMVDGEPVTELGTRINPATQQVDVGGLTLRPEGLERRYYLLNKPTGVVCTNERREMRPRAVDLITDPNKGRIYTVGRLDEDSTGLILCTNDGDFAQRISHPRHGVAKTYAVRVFGKITDEAVQKVRHGVHLSEGRTAGARVVVLRRTAAGSNLEVTLREGKNREVRRTFARVGHKVLTLKRVRIGPLNDRGLKIGRWRPLSREEVEALLKGSSEIGSNQPFHPSQDMPMESYGSDSGGDSGGYESRPPERAPRPSGSPRRSSRRRRRS